MHKETMLLKDKIKLQFPECTKIYTNYIQPFSYTFSSDKIKIKTDVPFDQLKDFLNKNSCGIAIYRKGGIASMWGDEFNSTLFGYPTNVEFIEIENVQRVVL